jgi:hypothetical protein
MLAFPLLELGRMADAEKAARKGYELNKQDCWTHHNVSYNYLVCFEKLYLISVQAYSFLSIEKMNKNSSNVENLLLILAV